MALELKERRTISRLIRFGLLALAIIIGASWMMRRVPGRGNIGIETEVPTVETLGAGDIQIFNVDSTVDLTLRGNQILAGLSPKAVAKVREELQRSTEKETTGVGASIAQIVKKTVSEKIGTHAAYDIADIKDIRYDKGQLVLEWKRGGEHRFLGNMKVDGDREVNLFREADAERFIAAFRARK